MTRGPTAVADPDWRPFPRILEQALAVDRLFPAVFLAGDRQ
ncbi:hypothetical protein ACFR99_16750 [Haloarchaeobius amylolyticus]|uniref:Uncharacterized protein n=1 Tax=Haloarchaeobius amylolyticus TaxID=1198296 RepID=A0ABD6BJG0_9EURY